MKLRLAMIGVVAAGVGVAQTAGATKLRSTPIKLAQTVNLENQRPVSLKSFEIVMAAKDKSPEIIVGKLDGPLAAGARAQFPLIGAKGCLFEARWTFDDAKDSGDVDLCNDAHIVFAD